MQVTESMVVAAAKALAEAEATHDHKEPWINHAARAALSAALSIEQTQPVAAEEWQAIETAPRDGTTVLLIGGVYGGLPFPGKWDKPEFVSPVARWFSSISKGHLYNHVPTHWRPLPAPPTTRTTDSAETGGSATSSKDRADG